MKRSRYLLLMILATIGNPIVASAAEIDYRLSRVNINVSAYLTPTPPASDPLSRNLAWTFAENCRGGGSSESSWCMQSATTQERRPEMVLEVKGTTLSQLLPRDIRDAGAARFRWTGSKAGFTEHNLKVRVSRNRGGLFWESKF